MVVSLVKLLGDVEILDGLRLTLGTVLLSFAVALIGGAVLGFVIHRIAFLRQATAPVLAAWYAVPHFAFYPLFIVLFGLGRGPLIALGLMFSLVSMVIATIDGLDRENAVFLKVARVHQLTLAQRIWYVALPATLPHLMAGVKLAFVYSFIGVIAGEFILSTAGLGHEIAYAYDNFENERMYGLILLTLLIAALINTAFRLYERRSLRYRL
jgi:NitT/TauT family transport system permease protein